MSLISNIRRHKLHILSFGLLVIVFFTQVNYINREQHCEKYAIRMHTPTRFNEIENIREAISHSATSEEVFQRLQNASSNISKFHDRNDDRTYEPDGYKAAALARRLCLEKRLDHGTFVPVARMHYIPHRNITFCSMAKTGSTFWGRVFVMATEQDPNKYSQPYDVSLSEVYGGIGKRFTLNTNVTLNHDHFSFMFVRNPYSRILSAYVDKLVPPNPTFWRYFGLKAIAQFREGMDKAPKSTRKEAKHNNDTTLVGHDVTFAEFVRFVTDAELHQESPNPHISSVKKHCRPCSSFFTFIGKLENIAEDGSYIMNKIGISKKAITALETNISNLTKDDAITDSIRGPFGWKKDVLKHMSWDKALQRLWLKLQMRGLIEKDIKLELSDQQIMSMTSDRLIDIAREAHARSDPGKLKQQSKAVQKEAFASVPLKDLTAFRDAFKDDFTLLGYDPSPQEIFNRNENPVEPKVYFNKL
ncbi:uncharacterized protein LOC127860657 [Dreissena polymorpha]|nr:uncharacterized protein LOC127860657 [Dreissena polymorpha]